MRRVLFYLMPALLAFHLPIERAAAQNVDLGVSLGDAGLRSFYLSVSNYYRVPYREVVILRDRYGIPYDEIPVVLFLARRAHVAPVVIVDLRHRGRTWWDIALRFGLEPEVLFIPGGPPYGKAYGYYKFKPRKRHALILHDGEVVELVNVRMISEHHGYAPHAVVRMRERGRSFLAIHTEAERAGGEGHGGWDNGHRHREAFEKWDDGHGGQKGHEKRSNGHGHARGKKRNR